MSLERIRAVKADKGFKRGDIVVYSLILCLFLAVLFGVICGIGSEELRGFEIYYGNEKMYSYSFEEDKGAVYSDKITVLSDDGAGLKLRFENGEEFNEIYADKGKRSVYVTDANCSSRKDCAHTQAIDGGGKIIVCVPHELKIVPLGGGSSEIVTG